MNELPYTKLDFVSSFNIDLISINDMILKKHKISRWYLS